MKKLFSNPWVLGTIVVLAAAGLYLYFRNKNSNTSGNSSSRQKVKCCTKRDANCHCVDYKWIESQSPCDDPGCGGSSIIVNPIINVHPGGVGPGHAGNTGGMGSGDVGTGSFGG